MLTCNTCLQIQNTVGFNTYSILWKKIIIFDLVLKLQHWRRNRSPGLRRISSKSWWWVDGLYSVELNMFSKSNSHSLDSTTMFMRLIKTCHSVNEVRLWLSWPAEVTQDTYIELILLFSCFLPFFYFLPLLHQNEVPDAEPECDPTSATAAKALWNDRMALSGSNEFTIEVQDYIPFSE